jgi:hypothetical protein
MKMLKNSKTFGRGLGARIRQPLSAGGRLCRVYFSLDYERDFERVRKIRSSASVIPALAVGFDGLGAWNDVVRRGSAAVHASIDDALDNTVATVVCIGARTMGGKYLDYELERSLERGNPLIGLRINHLRDDQGRADEAGEAPPLIRTAGFDTYTYTDAEQLAVDIEEAIERGRGRLRHERMASPARGVSMPAYAS